MVIMKQYSVLEKSSRKARRRSSKHFFVIGLHVVCVVAETSFLNANFLPKPFSTSAEIVFIFAGPQRAIPSGQDGSILTSRVANQSTSFGPRADQHNHTNRRIMHAQNKKTIRLIFYGHHG